MAFNHRKSKPTPNERGDAVGHVPVLNLEERRQENQIEKQETPTAELENTATNDRLSRVERQTQREDMHWRFGSLECY